MNAQFVIRSPDFQNRSKGYTFRGLSADAGIGAIMSVPVTNAIWRQTSPVEVFEWLHTLPVYWWIAGGWALDLFLGETTRPHADIDVGIFRSDTQKAYTTLSEWEFFEAKEGYLTPLKSSTAPRKTVNSLWCKRRSECEWAFELMLDEGSDNEWTFRRDANIRRSVDRTICSSADGIPYLAPQIQLLYKSKDIRRKDQNDFDAVVGRLDRHARDWLRDSIAKLASNHPWLSEL